MIRALWFDVESSDGRLGTDVVIDGLSMRRGGTTILHGISFDLGPGVTALIGVNGAGKSTLMSVLAGGLEPSAGTVRVDGCDPYGRDRSQVLPKISLMPQSAHFPRNMTALEVLEYLAWLRGARSRAARANALSALDAVGLAPRRDVKIGQLSGGMIRRVALAQAIATSPSFLILDEPSTGLDPRQRRTMVQLLSSLRSTVLLSSHVMEDVAEVAERVLVLDRGRLRYDGTVEGLAATAPTGTPAHRAAEAGFLHVILGAGDE